MRTPVQDCNFASLQLLQAIAGADHNISLISIVEARVVSLLKGKNAAVQTLPGQAHVPSIVSVHLSNLAVANVIKEWI